MVFKKVIPALALAILVTGLQSCKKDQAAEQLITGSDSSVVEAPPAQDPAAAQQEVAQDQMLQDAKSKPLTNLVLSESTHNFGDIKKGETVEHVYEVTNTGTNPLIISNVKPGCGCTAPDYTKDPILPGKKGTITLKFDSSNFDGPVQKSAEVYANVDAAPVVIGFMGNVVAK